MVITRAICMAASAVLCVTVAGCSGPSVVSSSAPSSATAPNRSAPSPSSSFNCTAALVLAQVRQLFAGQDFEAHYLTIADKLTLSVWLVDPEIDPATTPSGMAQADRRAVERGLSISYQMVEQIPCVGRVFDQVNPMIVDGRFQHWYKDFLPVRAFEGLHNPTTDDLIAAIQATGAALQEPRDTPPPAAQTPPASSCGWSVAQAGVHAYFGAADNSAAYLIIGARLLEQGIAIPITPNDAGVEVQWTVRDGTEASDPQVRERLGHVAEALTCLWPAADSLEAFVVDTAGRTVVYAIVPASVIRTRTIPLPAGGVRIYHMTPAARP